MASYSSYSGLEIIGLAYPSSSSQTFLGTFLLTLTGILLCLFSHIFLAFLVHCSLVTSLHSSWGWYSQVPGMSTHFRLSPSPSHVFSQTFLFSVLHSVSV